VREDLWRRDYPDITDDQIARWVASVDKAVTKKELEALVEKIRRKAHG
jgi:hypothetical protein